MAEYRVLLVEDDNELRRLYREVFQRHHFEVYEADNGLSAIDQTLVHRPSIIILDLLLPRQGGLGALRILRSLPECRSIPVIVLTALPNPEYRQEAEKRVQGYFLKTEVRPKELVEKALAILEARPVN